MSGHCHPSDQDGERALLRHHGDLDAEPGLLDFAVNVRLPRPPRWLRARLAAVLDDLGSYPSARRDELARAAAADAHGRHADEVLVLNGAAEGFALLPNLAPRFAAVVHPSFTEPEVALRDAGVPVHRVPTDAAHRLRPEHVPERADLVVLGNPTNPTSVLHPADLIATLARPGRVLVVDEAFMDAVPGETESLAARRLPGLLVLRSLTKTWGLAGLRAGYALGDPILLGRLAGGRTPWPVSTLALEAVAACSAPAARAETERAARTIAAQRESMIRRLRAVEIGVHTPASAPFLLLRVPDGPHCRAHLRARGIAVRRADTFPGLSAEHLRVAVRPPEQVARLAAALTELTTMEESA